MSIMYRQMSEYTHITCTNYCTKMTTMKETYCLFNYKVFITIVPSICNKPNSKLLQGQY